MSISLTLFTQYLENIDTTRYSIAAVYALQVYEWLMMLEDEYKLIHLGRWTSGKVFYLLCRYYPLSVWPVIMWGYLGNHDVVLCSRVVRPLQGLLMPFQFFAQGVMCMRAYAFTGRDKRVLVLLLSCYAVLVGVHIWGFCMNIEEMPALFYILLGDSGCFPNYGLSDDLLSMRLGLVLPTALLMDFVSLSVVIVHCRRVRTPQGSLGKTFIHQGLGAFAIVFALHCVAFGLYFDPHDFRNGVGLPFILVVSNIIACRLILQLRLKVSPTATEISRQHSVLVRNALATRRHDEWVIGDESKSIDQMGLT